ncbi:hypothetical protein [Nannocystis sp.]|uniref:hypothetical protein n=1 Tax=Nannocystis sp. TaxID=1962667 RepID=UPI001B63E076|nr:hypothetical protein [Nannocystis sp.]MBK7829584.1 hypothetical protein [Nannocystis sp.]MBP6572549.1 hypothetical protein [Gemmatimonadales bacterium]
MKFSLLGLFHGQRHQVGALLLMRGETFIETIEDDAMAILIIFKGSVTITRQRQGAQVGLHLSPRIGEPVWLTSPGPYCVVARDPVVGVRMLRTGEGAR